MHHRPRAEPVARVVCKGDTHLLANLMILNASDCLQFIFTLLFIGTLVAGGYLLRNSERLFGVDPSIPSETDSGRAYGKLQAFVVWAHAVALTAAFAFLLH
jgi:hypothetical protein